MDCIFCKIIAGDIPCYKIFEDDKILAFLDINSLSPGHTLIVPKEHTLDLQTIDNNTLITILDKTRNISKIITEKMNADGYTLIQNNGNVQDIKHYHLHIVPKYNKKVTMSVEEVYKNLTK